MMSFLLAVPARVQTMAAAAAAEIYIYMANIVIDKLSLFGIDIAWRIFIHRKRQNGGSMHGV